jgi:hypothetical protein
MQRAGGRLGIRYERWQVIVIVVVIGKVFSTITFTISITFS